jgi:hypothetical protein
MASEAAVVLLAAIDIDSHAPWPAGAAPDQRARVPVALNVIAQPPARTNGRRHVVMCGHLVFPSVRWCFGEAPYSNRYSKPRNFEGVWDCSLMSGNDGLRAKTVRPWTPTDAPIEVGGQVVAGSNPLSPTHKNPLRTAPERVLRFRGPGPIRDQFAQNLPSGCDRPLRAVRATSVRGSQ